jgi:putative membrane protein
MMSNSQPDNNSEPESKIKNEEKPIADTEFLDISTWDKLSPISILFFLNKIFSLVINNALPTLAPLGVLILNADSKATSALLIFVGAFVLLSLNAILQYFFFRFKVQENRLLIHDGVFNKNQRVIRFDKVQNVNILQPFYFKFFKLVTLQLETAGSKNNEANLAGITSTQAELIKQTILDYRSENSSQCESENQHIDATDEGEILSTASTKDLFKFGLTSNGMFWFFVFMAPVFGMLDKIIENNIDKEMVNLLIERLGGGISGSFIFGAIIILSIFTLMITFSILGAVFRYHNYKLTFKGETLRRHSGLLGTHEESAKLSKIQAFVNQTNFIGRWLKVENVVLKQASGAQNAQTARAKLFVIPTLAKTQVLELLKFILNSEGFDTPLNQINKRYILKTWLKVMSVPTILSLIMMLNIGSYPVWFLLLSGIVLFPLVYLRWRNFGYAINDNFATFRSGFFGFRRITFPLFKAQRVSISQSPMQKRKDLATLKIYLASDRIEIPYVPIEHAHAWFDQISYKIETTKQNWF